MTRAYKLNQYYRTYNPHTRQFTREEIEKNLSVLMYKQRNDLARLSNNSSRKRRGFPEWQDEYLIKIIEERIEVIAMWENRLKEIVCKLQS